MKMLRIVLMLLSACVVLAQQPTVSFSGVVIDAASNRPLPGTTLELRTGGADPIQAYPGLSNENGQFTFRNIPPGTYTLTAARNGYVRTEYGQRGPNGKGMPLTLAINQQPPAIRMPLTQSGAISGRITDPRGLPYPYVQITARRAIYNGGLQTFSAISAGYTNDLGEYRLWNLPPGQYQIMAEVNTQNQRIQPATATMIPPLPGGIVVDPITRGSMNAVPDPANVNVRRNATTLLGGPKAPVYYKNTTDERLATLIDLKPGNDLGGIDLVAGTTTLVPMTISVPPTTAQMTLFITPSQTVVNLILPRSTTMLMFTVPPGSYTVAGQGRDTANNAFIGYGTVEVNPLNQTTLNLNVSAPIEVSGRVILEGQPDSPDLPKLKIRLRRNPVLVGIPELNVTPGAGGTFSKTQALPPGEYFVEVSGYTGTLGGAFVKSIRVKETALSGNTIQVGGEGITGLEIVLGTRGGQLEGNAISASGEAWSNVVVALVPDQRARFDLFKTMTTDASGHFRFDGIAPGAYKLFSWEDVETDAWLIPDFVRSQEDRGKGVQVVEGERETVNAAIIPMR